MWKHGPRLFYGKVGKNVVNVGLVFGEIGDFRRVVRLKLRQSGCGVSDAKIAKKVVRYRSPVASQLQRQSA
ncbi:MAG: hypothetical protein GC179_12410 [Anaerolineaceae bacterium]|nr:hypothetical protein [Anaerolineaceae bacterium]